MFPLLRLGITKMPRRQKVPAKRGIEKPHSTDCALSEDVTLSKQLYQLFMSFMLPSFPTINILCPCSAKTANLTG